MGIDKLLKEKAEEILARSVAMGERARLRHYEETGTAVLQQRLRALFDLTFDAVKGRNVTLLVKHAEKIAQERFVSGYDLSEVQTAFNVLEETIWKTILKEMQPEDYAEALGLVSTALGAGKDALAQTYVSLASKTKAPSIDLRRAFQGTDALVESW